MEKLLTMYYIIISVQTSRKGTQFFSLFLVTLSMLKGQSWQKIVNFEQISLEQHKTFVKENNRFTEKTVPMFAS